MIIIKQVCKTKGIKLSLLASKLGISRTALNNQMNGNPTIASLQRIAKELDCNVIELLSPENGFIHVYDNGVYKGTIKI